MSIALVDESLPFDGFSPAARALGGFEKAVVGLASALARRGHRISVFNRIEQAAEIDGVRWAPLAEAAGQSCDLLIACRRTGLLDSLPGARKYLWSQEPGPRLERMRPALLAAGAGLLLVGPCQLAGWRADGSVPLRLLAPAVGDAFRHGGGLRPDPRPTAILTTHPAHGLDGVLDLWQAAIRPAVPEARLLVVSALLAADNPPPALAAIKAKAAALAGVEIVGPGPDATMAALYRQARVHLYPGHEDDMACWTLADSQACGLPAVARRLGGAAERIIDGGSGQLVPDDEAFANLAIRLLSDDETFWSMNRDAALNQAGRGWAEAAAECERLLGIAP